MDPIALWANLQLTLTMQVPRSHIAMIVFDLFLQWRPPLVLALLCLVSMPLMCQSSLRPAVTMNWSIRNSALKDMQNIYPILRCHLFLVVDILFF